jgi:hypothetical protein
MRYDKKRRLAVTVSVVYSCPNVMKLELPQQIFEKNPQTSNFMKIRPVGVELFHADVKPD